DGERLRGQAWWPKQSLTVFQPLIPPDWTMTLRGGEMYAQVAFSAAPDQGFEAGGHGVLKAGSAWMPDNEINGVDFVLPFRLSQRTWSLDTRGPVTLRIDEVKNLVKARNITADLQGDCPWTEPNPRLLTNAKVEARERNHRGGFCSAVPLKPGCLVAGRGRGGNVTNRRAEKPGHSPKYHRGSPGRLSLDRSEPAPAHQREGGSARRENHHAAVENAAARSGFTARG